MSAERRDRDPVSLSAGIAITALGVLLLADQLDGISLTFGWLGAATSAVVGTILLISGLRDQAPPPAPAPAAPPSRAGRLERGGPVGG